MGCEKVVNCLVHTTIKLTSYLYFVWNCCATTLYFLSFQMAEDKSGIQSASKLYPKVVVYEKQLLVFTLWLAFGFLSKSSLKS